MVLEILKTIDCVSEFYVLNYFYKRILTKRNDCNFFIFNKLPLPLTMNLSYKNKKPVLQPAYEIGGAKRDRTADLLNAIQALSQLSYNPIQVPSKIRHL